MITPQLFAITAFLSLTWGAYLVGTVYEYRRTLRNPSRRRQDIVISLRRMIVALCVLALPLSFLVRTALVLVGLGDEAVGQILFFALLGVNVTGSLFAVVSLWYD